jgi:hypothetical protein
MILAVLIAPLVLISGDTPSFPYGVPVRPAPVFAPHPVPFHTPAFTGPHPVPAYHPAPVVHAPGFAPRPSAPVARPFVGTHAALVSRGIYVSHPTGIYRPGYAYYHGWYAGWHHGYWGWPYQPWIWFGAGVATGWLFPPVGVVAYWNPYFAVSVGPAVVPVYDYSQPIPVPASTLVTSTSTEAPTAEANAAAAARLLDDARQAFLARDYQKAQQLIDRAVNQSPTDAILHEFRALVLFTGHRYQEAAAVIHATLAVAPGWDWETLRANYADTQTYTTQLRALEEFVRLNPRDAASRFLLAYHYLVIDARDAATRTLKTVVMLEPKDQLAAHLVQLLEHKPDAGRPLPGM